LHLFSLRQSFFYLFYLTAVAQSEPELCAEVGDGMKG
jgi:hypothetical protein